MNHNIHSAVTLVEGVKWRKVQLEKRRRYERSVCFRKVNVLPIKYLIKFSFALSQIGDNRNRQFSEENTQCYPSFLLSFFPLKRKSYEKRKENCVYFTKVPPTLCNNTYEFKYTYSKHFPYRSTCTRVKSSIEKKGEKMLRNFSKLRN